MFSDFYVRIPVEKLRTEARFLIANRLCPEINIQNLFIKRMSPRRVQSLGKQIALFPSHTIHAPFMDIFPGAWDEDVRRLSFRKMNRVMELSAQSNTKLVVTHANYDPVYYHHSFPDWVKRCGDFYRRLLEIAPNTLVAIENIADSIPMVMGKLFQEIGDPRCIPCLDIGHHHVFSRLPVQEWLNAFRRFPFIHFHFHDNRGDDDIHLPMGKGTIDWQELKRSIDAYPVPFSVTLEPHTHADIISSVSFYRKFFL